MEMVMEEGVAAVQLYSLFVRMLALIGLRIKTFIIQRCRLRTPLLKELSLLGPQIPRQSKTPRIFTIPISLGMVWMRLMRREYNWRYGRFFTTRRLVVV